MTVFCTSIAQKSILWAYQLSWKQAELSACLESALHCCLWDPEQLGTRASWALGRTQRRAKLSYDQAWTAWSSMRGCVSILMQSTSNEDLNILLMVVSSTFLWDWCISDVFFLSESAELDVCLGFGGERVNFLSSRCVLGLVWEQCW